MGFEVTDRAGTLTGYMVLPGGFVERSVAESPERMDAWLEAAQPSPKERAVQAAAEAEAKAASEADRAAREARANN